MVLKFYNLKEQPFGVTPDPRYLFLTPTHREALASLVYGVMSGRGFVGLVAKPGMGKTTLLFQLLQNLKHSARTVFLFQTLCTPRDFIKSLLADLGVEANDSDIVNLHAKLNEVLVRETRSGKRLVVVIDEAQNLDNSVLEVVRMLSNFETASEKLMQIVLAGQPQLADRLASPSLVQLRQRVSILARLKPLNGPEVAQYIEHRLRVAGYEPSVALFTERALDLIAAQSEGIPRNINNLCFNALSLGCAQGQRTIGHDLVEEVIGDLDLRTLQEESAPTAHVIETRKTPAMVPNFNNSAVASGGVVPRRLLPRLGVAAVLLLALSWVAVRAYRNASPVAASSNEVTAQSQRPAEQAGQESPSAARLTPGTASAGGSSSAPDISAPAPAPVLVSPSSAHEFVPDSESIRIKPDETLYRISVDNYGKYSGSIVARIKELNPNLKNPNLIRSGEKLRIPKDFQSSDIAQSAPERATNAQGDKVEKP